MAFQIKFHHLQAFVEVARQGSIRGAGRTLERSQPGLTKTIKELETGLAIQLFVRRREGVMLTEIGKGFYQHASLILEELRVAQEDIQQQQGELSGCINIGLSPSVANTLMPPIIHHFYWQYPHARVKVLEGSLGFLVGELRQGRLDFTINTHSPDTFNQDLVFEKVFEKTYAIFARRDHPMAQATSVAELLQCDWTVPTSHNGYFQALLKSAGADPMRLSIDVVCESISSTAGLVRQSDFLTILPIDCPEVEYGLVQIPIAETLPQVPYYLVQRRDIQQTLLAALLISRFRKASQLAG